MMNLGLSCLALAGMGAAWLPVADIYVDSSAPNCATATGTVGDPVCTISAGVALASPGDTILIAPGRYSERVTIGVDLELVGTGGDDVTVMDASGLGGSVVTVLSAATVVVDGLTITGGQALVGGGFRVFGDLVLRNSTVTENEARGLSTRGGGIGSQGLTASITIENSTISNNEAYALYGGFARGGGISAPDASLVVSNTTIDSNVATSKYKPAANSAGGGVHLFRSSLIMSGSTISNNVGGGPGGGVYGISSSLHLTNTTVSTNQAFRGSALYGRMATGTSYLGNVTITKNWVLYAMEVVELDALTMRNTIIAGNGPFPAIGDVGSVITSLGNNLIGAFDPAFIIGGTGDIVGSIAMPIDPLLGPLADNGGPTKTHRLLLGSPAIDAGSTVTFEMFDQRGLQRPLGNAPDIGAFELESFQSHCNGDGGDQLGCTDCPCMNNSTPGTVGGCLNSAGTSTAIAATGSTSASLPPGNLADLRFTLSGAPANSFCVLLSGSAVAPQNMANMCFGASSGVQSSEHDGLRCAVMNIKRHGGRLANAMGEVMASAGPNRVWGGEAQPNVGLAVQGGFVAGQTRYFQVTHRQGPLAVCMRGLNTSQAIEVTFTN